MDSAEERQGNTKWWQILMRSYAHVAFWKPPRLPPKEYLMKHGLKGVDFEPYRGPVLFQTMFLWIFLLFIPLSAQISNWVAELRLPSFILYMTCAIIVQEWSRFFMNTETMKNVPIYLALVPILGITFITREGHVLTALLTFVCVLVTFCQATVNNMKSTIARFVILFIAGYTVIVWYMSIFYVDDGKDPFKGRILSPQIAFGEEAVVTISMGIVGVLLYQVVNYIQMYVHLHTARAEAISGVHAQYLELRESVVKDEQKTSHLVTPLEEAIQGLEGLKGRDTMSVEELNELERIAVTLATKQLYGPNFLSRDVDDLDKDAQDWLFGEVSREHRETHKTKTEQKKRLISGENLPDTIFTGEEEEKLLWDNDGTLQECVCDSEMDENAVLSPWGAGAVNDFLKASIDTWDFDLLHLFRISGGRPLYALGFAAFVRLDLVERFSLDVRKLKNFLSEVEDGYKRNPYHNALHAADVTHALLWFCTQTDLKRWINETELLAVVIAAVIHDFRHPGLNNNFLRVTQSEIAARYNNRSILENYHMSEASRLLSKKDTSILEHFSREDLVEIRSIIGDMVLATDMANHFTIMTHFNLKVKQNMLDKKKSEDRRILLKICIKMADMSNPARSRKLSRYWTTCIQDEFYAQGDRERAIGIPVSPFMDRYKTIIWTFQLAFSNIFVIPIYESAATLFRNLDPIVKAVKENKERWIATEAKYKSHEVRNPTPRTAQHIEDSMINRSQKVGLRPVSGLGLGMQQLELETLRADVFRRPPLRRWNLLHNFDYARAEKLLEKLRITESMRDDDIALQGEGEQTLTLNLSKVASVTSLATEYDDEEDKDLLDENEQSELSGSMRTLAARRGGHGEHGSRTKLGSSVSTSKVGRGSDPSLRPKADRGSKSSRGSRSKMDA